MFLFFTLFMYTIFKKMKEKTIIVTKECRTEEKKCRWILKYHFYIIYEQRISDINLFSILQNKKEEWKRKKKTKKSSDCDATKIDGHFVEFFFFCGFIYCCFDNFYTPFYLFFSNEWTICIWKLFVKFIEVSFQFDVNNILFHWSKSGSFIISLSWYIIRFNYWSDWLKIKQSISRVDPSDYQYWKYVMAFWDWRSNILKL